MPNRTCRSKNRQIIVVTIALIGISISDAVLANRTTPYRTDDHLAKDPSDIVKEPDLLWGSVMGVFERLFFLANKRGGKAPGS